MWKKRSDSLTEDLMEKERQVIKDKDVISDLKNKNSIYKSESKRYHK